jgi:Na+/melibiose symporter-like transporter
MKPQSLPPGRFSTRFWFGLGQAGEGIKTTALAAVVLFYYAQVLNLDPRLAGLALLLATATDGVSDLLVGAWSDTLRHRWGRRHPPMYASILPFGLGFMLLFAVPHGLGRTWLFAWLLGTALIARNAMTLFVVPHFALGAELSTDHDGRTVVVAFRAFFANVGLGITFLAGALLFVPTKAFPTGQLNPVYYPLYGLILGLLIMAVTLASTLGTHACIPYLPQPAPGSRFSVRRAFADLWQAFRSPSFRIFMAGFFTWAIGLIVFKSIEIYLGTYFWRLQQSLVFLLPLAGAVASLAGTLAWVWIVRRIGKKASFIASMLGFSLVYFGLVLLKQNGLMPAGQGTYLAAVFVGSMLAAMIAAAPGVVGGSMLADIADEVELMFTARREGILFGAISFVTKISIGLGAQIAGFLVSWSGLPAHAAPASVSDAVSARLADLTIGFVLAVAVAATLMYLAYPLSRARHAVIQASLAKIHAATGGQSCRAPN